MRLFMLFVAAVTLVACATPAMKEADTSVWEAFGYEGMADEINRLAGASSVNCGIRNYLESGDPVNAHMSPVESRACIKQSIHTKTPFRYGSIRIPIDSFLFDALVLSEAGEFWTIRYDVMVDGTHNANFIERCKSVRVDYSRLAYEGIDCKTVTTEEWLADIADSGQ